MKIKLLIFILNCNLLALSKYRGEATQLNQFGHRRHRDTDNISRIKTILNLRTKKYVLVIRDFVNLHHYVKINNQMTTVSVITFGGF